MSNHIYRSNECLELEVFDTATGSDQTKTFDIGPGTYAITVITDVAVSGTTTALNIYVDYVDHDGTVHQTTNSLTFAPIGASTSTSGIVFSSGTDNKAYAVIPVNSTLGPLRTALSGRIRFALTNGTAVNGEKCVIRAILSRS